MRTASARIDITVPGRSRRGRPGIVLHLVRHLHPDDRWVKDGIPVTSIPRTLLDLAATSPRHVKRAFEEADLRGLLDARDVTRLVARSRGRHGVPVLTALLASYRGPPPPVRSELERRFFELCREGGLPTPSVNVSIAGMEADMVWEEGRLVVEVDGRSFHATRAAFEEDRIRDASLQLAGYRVVRVTHRRLEAAPAEVLDVVRRLLR